MAFAHFFSLLFGHISVTGKAKTRFYATIDGKDRELFSVREVAGDGLLIAPLRQSSPFPRNGLSYRELHFSVHKSNEGQDTTITHKVNFSDGSSESHVAFIKGTQEVLLWPIMFRRQGFEKREMRLRLNDRGIGIGRYETMFTTMFYSVFVTLSALGHLSARSDEFKLYATPFRYFQLFTLVSFVDLPTVPSGYREFIPTSSPVFGGVRDHNHEQHTAYSIRGEDMFALHLERSSSMRDAQMETGEDWSDDFLAAYSFCVNTLKGGRLRADPSINFK